VGSYASGSAMNPVAIDSIGMLTPAAGGAGGSVGAIYVGARRFDDLPPVSRDAIVGARINIPNQLAGLDRFLFMGAHVLWQAVDADLATRKIGLAVCAPSETDEPDLTGQSDRLLAGLAREAQLLLAPRACRVFAAGRAAIFDALPFALAVLGQADLAAVALLGVDSLVTKPRLRRAVERGGTTADGAAIPGEGAAAMLFTRRARSAAVAVLTGVGFASEPSATNREKNVGRGLQAAMANAIAGAGMPKATFGGLVHDGCGSAESVEELAWAKTSPLFAHSPELSILAPSVAMGDAGAAMGTMSLATAAFLLERRAWTGAGLCCLGAGDKRGAVVLAPVTGASG